MTRVTVARMTTARLEHLLYALWSGATPPHLDSVNPRCNIAKFVWVDTMLIRWLMPILASLAFSTIAVLIAHQQQSFDLQPLPAYQLP